MCLRHAWKWPARIYMALRIFSQYSIRFPSDGAHHATPSHPIAWCVPKAKLTLIDCASCAELSGASVDSEGAFMAQTTIPHICPYTTHSVGHPMNAKLAYVSPMRVHDGSLSSRGGQKTGQRTIKCARGDAPAVRARKARCGYGGHDPSGHMHIYVRTSRGAGSRGCLSVSRLERKRTSGERMALRTHGDARSVTTPQMTGYDQSAENGKETVRK